MAIRITELTFINPHVSYLFRTVQPELSSSLHECYRRRKSSSVDIKRMKHITTEEEEDGGVQVEQMLNSISLDCHFLLTF